MLREFGRLGLAPCPLGVNAMDGVCVALSTTTVVLYWVIRVHLTDFLIAVAARSDGVGLPAFVTAEFQPGRLTEQATRTLI